MTVTRTQIIKAMCNAAAIVTANPGMYDHHLPDDHTRNSWKETMTAVLNAIGQLAAIVPRKPTGAMINAGEFEAIPNKLARLENAIAAGDLTRDCNGEPTR